MSDLAHSANAAELSKAFVALSRTPLGIPVVWDAIQ
jgi:hypothetical protein